MDDQFSSGVICFGTTTLFQDVLDHTGPERRKEQRHPRTINIMVQPMDAREIHTAPHFAAVTRDISRGGLSFISFQRTNSDTVAISLQDDDSRKAICCVCSCREILGDEGEKAFLTGVEFLYERYN